MTTRHFHRLSLPQECGCSSDGYWHAAHPCGRHREVVNNS
ncbi:hypothetical protein GLA29479_3977 [Lysobacter antibioticus]|uniref:Uncharacterized protein n=1 Tax=Lysobacter antibioticus TaxID=84531 RepID=A0A0S2FGR1_LYSAN|nr:hypothetical protein GLA29479_3977 [Lysobacter antibioticus]ALN82674.1 hypothetical protein LA76x_4566 [Lysobacter antibioticus]